MEELNQTPEVVSDQQPVAKNNSFLVSLLSTLLLLAVLIAGFFAYQTQNLVKELNTIKNKEAIGQTPTPSVSPKALFDAISFDNLKDGDTITSPFKLTGMIDKSWTFESTFSIEILDKDRKSLKQSPVNVSFENEDSQFGSFSETLTFSTQSESGFVVAHADNPSGLPENDKSFEVPVFFYKNQVSACTMEAKICPDGSAVGRSGPKCEFAPCPTPKP